MISIGEPDVVVWFEDLLRLHGIKPEPFECNQFTREILLALKGALNVPEFHDLDLNHLVEVSPEADRLLDRMASMLSSINSADADSLSLITACEKLLLNGRNLKKRKHARREYDGWGKRELESTIGEMQRTTNVLKQKREEYLIRLSHLESQWAERDARHGSFASLADQIASITALQEKLSLVENDLEPYCKLPADLSLAKLKVEETRRQLEQLTWERDHLLHQKF